MVNLPISTLGSESESLPSAANNGASINGKKPGKESSGACQEARKTTTDSDVAGAREAERRTRESEDPSWLAKNIHHLLAIGIMGLTFSLYTIVILGGSKDGFLKPETKDIVIYILGALTTVATQVVSYYFGSSSGSADKSRALNMIAKRG